MNIGSQRTAIERFCNHCWWLHEVRCALGVMCDFEYTDTSVECHMYRVVCSMKEHYFLQVCKLLDPKVTGKGKIQNNLVVDFVISELALDESIQNKLRAEKQKMMPFVQKLRVARNKIIAHIDLDIALRKNCYLGAYEKEDEKLFFDALGRFVVIADTEINGASGFEWPAWPSEDAREFMDILQRAGCATPDQQGDLII